MRRKVPSHSTQEETRSILATKSRVIDGVTDLTQTNSSSSANTASKHDPPHSLSARLNSSHGIGSQANSNNSTRPPSKRKRSEDTPDKDATGSKDELEDTIVIESRSGTAEVAHSKKCANCIRRNKNTCSGRPGFSCTPCRESKIKCEYSKKGDHM